ncbi:MAG: hypothetical protein IH876_00040 [Gemmatimonadetes bacterium]|nr:hypothetical protein [Gemmatimonadota bacterium]
MTLRDGSRVNLRVPYMLRDSLIGSRYERGLGRVAIPLNEITMVETAELDGHATASLVVGYIFVIAGVLSALTDSAPTGQELFSAGRLQTDRRDP